MKILNRKEFLALEGQCLFVKTDMYGNPKDDLSIKYYSAYDASCDDFAVDCLEPTIAIENDGDMDLSHKTDMLIEDSDLDLPMDFRYTGRDGMHDTEQEALFAVYSKEDVKQLIERLKETL